MITSLQHDLLAFPEAWAMVGSGGAMALTYVHVLLFYITLELFCDASTFGSGITLTKGTTCMISFNYASTKFHCLRVFWVTRTKH